MLHKLFIPPSSTPLTLSPQWYWRRVIVVMKLLFKQFSPVCCYFFCLSLILAITLQFTLQLNLICHWYRRQCIDIFQYRNANKHVSCYLHSCPIFDCVIWNENRLLLVWCQRPMQLGGAWFPDRWILFTDSSENFLDRESAHCKASNVCGATQAQREHRLHPCPVTEYWLTIPPFKNSNTVQILSNLCNFKQERQCTSNITLRHVWVTTVAVEKQ
jgi:hypothetical protein